MKKKGYALLTVVILTAFLMIVSLAIISNVVNVIKTNNIYEKSIDNAQLSTESGIEYGYSWLQKNCNLDAYNPYKSATGVIKKDLTIDNINNYKVTINITSDRSYYYIQSVIQGKKAMTAKVPIFALTTTGSSITLGALKYQ